MHLETYGGTYFSFSDPTPDQVDIFDIARSLSQTNRFGGHAEFPISVAEHSVFVSGEVISAGRPDLALPALLHDGHEAYIGDIPTPLKIEVGEILMKIVKPIDAAIAAKFGFNPELFAHPVVKAADLLALRREAATIKRSGGVGGYWGNEKVFEPLPRAGLAWRKAESLFLRTYKELSIARVA